jgi:SP family sugar:H+ symporter-like MFS transporter
MALFNRKKEPEAHAGEISPSEKATPAQTPADRTPANNSQSSLPIQAEHNSHVAPEEALKKQPVTPFAVILGAIASIGGFMFGYESGQISGKSRFYREPHIKFSNAYDRFLADERFPRPIRREWTI